MNVSPNPNFPSLLGILQRLKNAIGPWKGFCFRSSALEFARPKKLLSGAGALSHGGRWNAPGSFRCVYLSNAGTAAYVESLPIAQRHGLNDALIEPRVVIAIELIFQRMLDIPELAAKAPQIDLKGLLSEDWRTINDNGLESNSKAFGRAAYTLGAEAILVPSADSDTATNTIIFPENLGKGSSMEVIGKAKLNRLLLKPTGKSADKKA